MLWIFFLLAAAAGIGAFLAGLLLWQAALVFVGAFLGLNLLYAVFWVCVAQTVDDTKPIEKQRPIYRFGCANIAGWLCQWFGVRIHLRGTELLPETDRFLLVCNHRSGFDPIVTEYALRRWNIAFITKPSNLKIPLIAKLAYGAGFLPIDRENDREALKTILRAAGYLKQGLFSVCVYPEGTRSRTGELLPFHAGSFKIAQKANVPVAVAAIRGSEKVVSHFLRRPKDIYLDILEVIPAEQVKAMGTQELAAHSRNLIESALSREAKEGAA